MNCAPDQLNGLFLYLDNYHTKKKHKSVSQVGWKIFREEPLQTTDNEKECAKEKKKYARKRDESKHICKVCGEILGWDSIHCKNVMKSITKNVTNSR